jgi:hypothetical protein
MSTTFLISSSCYGLVALISILFGSIYLLKNEFMPYHREAVGRSWSELEPNFQVLIIALMRAVGGGFLATGLTIFILLLIPWRAGDTWSIYAIPAIGLCTLLGTLSATLLVKTKTPGKPPVGLSLLALALTVIGFIFSLI